MASFSIRAATRQDCDGIGTVLREVWGDNLLEDVYQAQIDDCAYAVRVAIDVATDSVAAFGIGFPVLGSSSRWQIDLLAVRPIHQRKGLGKLLLQSLVSAGRRQGHTRAEGVVRVGNTGSEKAFESHWFVPDELVQMMAWAPSDASITAGPESVLSSKFDIGNTGQLDIRLLPMNTVTYKGMWIEGFDGCKVAADYFDVETDATIADVVHRVVKIARDRIHYEGRTSVTALLPKQLVDMLPDVDTSRDCYGQYRVFRCDLSCIPPTSAPLPLGHLEKCNSGWPKICQCKLASSDLQDFVSSISMDMR